MKQLLPNISVNTGKNVLVSPWLYQVSLNKYDIWMIQFCKIVMAVSKSVDVRADNRHSSGIEMAAWFVLCVL